MSTLLIWPDIWHIKDIQKAFINYLTKGDMAALGIHFFILAWSVLPAHWDSSDKRSFFALSNLNAGPLVIGT